MEFLGVLLGVLLFLVVTTTILYNNDDTLIAAVGIFCALILYIGFTILVINEPKGKTIVIQKSSDSEWEYSDRQDIKADTTITRIVILNGDTLYPTTKYKVIFKN